jgi:hypothetical protein
MHTGGGREGERNSPPPRPPRQIFKKVLIKCYKTKQWRLAGEFSEFEYSPEICHFWRIRVLPKMVFLKNWSDSLNSPSFANLVCSDSPDSPTFANLVSSDSPDSRKPSFASNKRIWRIWQIWRIWRVWQI